MLPMTAAVAGPTSFKKLPVEFWEAIFAGAGAADVDAARAMLKRAADELLANPVMEDYEVVVGSSA